MSVERSELNVERSAPRGAVFLSYASQDAEAAKRICEALRAAGVEVWFDQSELVGGDQWDAKIRGQISSCALFVPVISANTQARLEGYFRLEWKLAAQRTHTMADEKTFLLPVVVDATRDPEARVPAEYKTVQWTKLPGGETPPGFVARVKKLLSGDVEASLDDARGLPSEATDGRRQATPLRPRLNKWWWVLPIFGVTMALFLVLKEGRKDPAPPPASAAPPALSGSNGLTAAQKLVQQAQKIYGGSDELDRETLILADDLVKRALAADSTEPTAWLLGARLSYTMVWQSFDSSEARKADLQRQAARARTLAPDSVPAQLALANARLAVAYSNFQSASNRQDLAGVEQDLRALAAQAPGDYQVQRALGQTYRFLKRPDEALRALQRALELSGGEPGVAADMINVLLRRKRYAEAEAMVAPALARRPIGRMLALDVLFKLQWRGDPAGAQAALAAWPGWLLREDRGAFIAWQTWLWSRRPDMALDVAQRLPRDYLRDVWFTGPRAVLTARAHEQAGNREAALADWRTAVRLADQELAGSPEDAAALFWKAWALSRLGDPAGAEAAATLLQQRMTSQTVFFSSTNLALLWSTLGRTDLAAAHLRAGFGADNDAYAVTRAMLELDPAYAPLRSDPHYAELAAAALAPAPKPEDGGQKSEVSAPIDQKSVAVLAFANLSDDKGNEYFSDGISEELLNVLAKIPGLKVTARTSSFHFKGMNTAIPEIAQQLGVAYVVEGSVRKAGDKVRITAQLIKAADGFHVWSDTFTRDLKDIFAVQDEIAGLIAQNLEMKMGVVAATQTVDPEAYRLYLEAQPAITLRTREGYDRAEQLLTRAVERDPSLVPAQAALAVVWSFRAQEKLEMGSTDSPQVKRIVAQAEMAVRLGPGWAEAQAACGLIYSLSLRFAEGEQYLRRAVQINPSYAPAHLWLGRILLGTGRMDEALVELKHATELDPLSHRALDNYAFALLDAGQPRAALEFVDRALRLQPDSVQAVEVKAAALAQTGRLTEALAIVDPRRAQSIGDLEYTIEVYFLAGRRSELEALLTGSLRIRRLDRFYALAALGRNEEALAELESTAVDWGFLDSLLFNPLLDPIRSNPRFQANLQSSGFVEYHARAQAWRAAHPRDKPEVKK